jgi:hypothetical protein
LANTKIGAKKKTLNNKDNMEWGIWWYVGMWYVICWYVGMWYVAYWYVICWYGDKYWKYGYFCQIFGKNKKWTKKSIIKKKYGHIETLKVWP